MPQPSSITGYLDDLQGLIDTVDQHDRVFYAEDVAVAQEALEAIQQHVDELYTALRRLLDEGECSPMARYLAEQALNGAPSDERQSGL
jgi:hypothetical protein